MWVGNPFSEGSVHIVSREPTIHPEVLERCARANLLSSALQQLLHLKQLCDVLMCVRARACVRVRVCTVRGACRMLEDERDLVRAADGLARMAALVAHPEFDAILDGAEFIGLCQAHELAAMPRYENRRRTKKNKAPFFVMFRLRLSRACLGISSSWRVGRGP